MQMSVASTLTKSSMHKSMNKHQLPLFASILYISLLGLINLFHFKRKKKKKNTSRAEGLPPFFVFARIMLVLVIPNIWAKHLA